MSDETTPQATPEPAEPKPGNLPATVPDSKLSIKKNRLADSPHCLNCGTELLGPFCHFCGQPDKNLVRFFPALLREMLEDFADFDSRFMRSLKPLLFKPGKLTRDYLDGRRFRYVPPMRLYIFSSIAMFFLLAVSALDPIQIRTDTSGGPNIQIHMDEGDPEALRESLKGLDDVRPGLSEQVASSIEEAARETEEADAAKAGSDELDEIQFDVDGKPWDPETNPVVLPLVPDRVNDWVNREIAESPQKARAIEENPDLITDQALDVLPITMFVLLPLVALIFKFWYLFARKYYVEHLIFALHNHSFLFVIVILMILFGTIGEWHDPGGEGLFSRIDQWVDIVLMCWVPVYLLLSLKRVYGQGWMLTLSKFTVIGLSYLVLLVAATVFAGLLSFVLI